MNMLSFVPLEEIRRIRETIGDPILRCTVLADICRINTLYMIMQAGSGHIGSSFSAMDLVVWLWDYKMNDPNNKGNPDSDIFFSSKGHDVPGLYSVLLAYEKLPFEMIHKLRRFDGLPGHPDINTPFIATNTGSLGMGVSKARGMAIAKRLNGSKGKIFVLTGDGELQEGQFWESLSQVANKGLREITVIVDLNGIQSDEQTWRVNNLDDLASKLRSFGWHVRDRFNGHAIHTFEETFKRTDMSSRMPMAVIADTVKGKGVSFMEGENGMRDGLYQYHSGAPSQIDYEAAVAEISTRINRVLVEEIHISALELEKQGRVRVPAQAGTREKIIPAYGDELVHLAHENKGIVALDADLVKDTGLIPFREEFPKRFLECGIAEQDMVSVAGGLALQGKLPIVHSFACFLTARASEQIYNNATEGKKIIYVGSLAGLLPAGPGHSHQAVRDIALMGSVPGMTCIQPCNEREAGTALRWAVRENEGSTYIRLTSIPFIPQFSFGDDYRFSLGKGGVVYHEGFDAAIIAYGPIMLNQAVLAAKALKAEKIKITVVNLPWLNQVDAVWLADLARTHNNIITLDDHLVSCGQGTMLAGIVGQSINSSILALGIKGIPKCGKDQEVLKAHCLDVDSIVNVVAGFIA